jgi:hypothetical protein
MFSIRNPKKFKIEIVNLLNLLKILKIIVQKIELNLITKKFHITPKFNRVNTIKIKFLLKIYINKVKFIEKNLSVHISVAKVTH